MDTYLPATYSGSGPDWQKFSDVVTMYGEPLRPHPPCLRSVTSNLRTSTQSRQTNYYVTCFVGSELDDWPVDDLMREMIDSGTDK